MPEPMIIGDPELVSKAESDYWTTPEMFDAAREWPSFRTSEVGKCFFGMSPGWVRKYVGRGFQTDGEVFQTLLSRNGRDHIWRLYDIERWAHALAENRIISGQQLELTIGIVIAVARLHRFVK